MRGAVAFRFGGSEKHLLNDWRIAAGRVGEARGFAHFHRRGSHGFSVFDKLGLLRPPETVDQVVFAIRHRQPVLAQVNPGDSAAFLARFGRVGGERANRAKCERA